MFLLSSLMNSSWVGRSLVGLHIELEQLTERNNPVVFQGASFE